MRGMTGTHRWESECWSTGRIHPQGSYFLTGNLDNSGRVCQGPMATFSIRGSIQTINNHVISTDNSFVCVCVCSLKFCVNLWFVTYLILKRFHHNIDLGPIKPLTCKKKPSNNINNRNSHIVPTKCTVRTQKVLNALMSTAAQVWINAKKWRSPRSCSYASISLDRARNSKCPPTLICFRGINAESHGWESEEYRLKMEHQQIAACASSSSVHT